MNQQTCQDSEILAGPYHHIEIVLVTASVTTGSIRAAGTAA